MHGGGAGVFALGLKAHTMIGPVVTAVLWAQGEQSIMFNFVPDSGFCIPELCIAHRQIQRLP